MNHRLINKKLVFLILLTVLALSAQPVMAIVQLEVDFPKIGDDEITVLSSLPQTIKYIFNLAIVLATFAVFLSLIYGGFIYLSSTGNPGKMADGKKRIINSALGLLILLGSYFLLRTANPQLLVLKINKKEVEARGVLLLNELAYEDVMGFGGVSGALKDPSASDEDIQKALQKLLSAPLGEAKAVYLHGSVPDLRKRFGLMLMGSLLPGISSKLPRVDDRYQYDYPSVNGVDLDHFTFQYFKPYALYFAPGANAEVVTYFNSDFEKISSGVLKAKKAQGHYVYPNCSKQTGPCKFKLLDGFELSGFFANMIATAGNNRVMVNTVPLSIEIKHNGPGVYLKADDFWETIYLQDKDSVEFLRDKPYDFDDKAKRIEVKNWSEERDETTGQIELKKTANYLAILHEDEEFKGQLRIFFEETYDPLVISWGNVSEGGGIRNIVDNSGNSISDVQGTVKSPSSVQIFQMPNSQKEWDEWFEDGCVVDVCAQKGLKECYSYKVEREGQINGFTVSSNLERNTEVLANEDINGDGTINEQDKKNIDFNNNIRSLNIKGDCIVVLFDDPKTAWHGGGDNSEVLVPWGKEFDNNGGYQDLTHKNTAYQHQTGFCNCSWIHRLRRTRGTCYPCASSIAIYPIINN